MKYVFVAIYLLVLLTQVPHVQAAYADLERGEWYKLAAWGAAVAFEASTGIFTYRLVKGSRRRWTRFGLYFFLLAAVVANLAYYRVLGWTSFVAPYIFAVALPVSLALFAEEFGAEVKKEERAQKREVTQQEGVAAQQKPASAWDGLDSYSADLERIWQQHGSGPFTRVDAEQLLSISRATASRMLLTAQEAGVVTRSGAGRNVVYRVSTPPDNGDVQEGGEANGLN